MGLLFSSSLNFTYSVSHNDISEIANMVKHVPEAFINERGNNVTDECARYLLPLIAGEAGPAYKDGIPQYLIIE